MIVSEFPLYSFRGFDYVVIHCFSIFIYHCGIEHHAFFSQVDMPFLVLSNAMPFYASYKLHHLVSLLGGKRSKSSREKVHLEQSSKPSHSN
jgi:hypothetical protein